MKKALPLLLAFAMVLDNVAYCPVRTFPPAQTPFQEEAVCPQPLFQQHVFEDFPPPSFLTRCIIASVLLAGYTIPAHAQRTSPPKTSPAKSGSRRAIPTAQDLASALQKTQSAFLALDAARGQLMAAVKANFSGDAELQNEPVANERIVEAFANSVIDETLLRDQEYGKPDDFSQWPSPLRNLARNLAQYQLAANQAREELDRILEESRSSLGIGVGRDRVNYDLALAFSAAMNGYRRAFTVIPGEPTHEIFRSEKYYLVGMSYLGNGRALIFIYKGQEEQEVTGTSAPRKLVLTFSANLYSLTPENLEVTSQGSKSIPLGDPFSSKKDLMDYLEKHGFNIQKVVTDHFGPQWDGAWRTASEFTSQTPQGPMVLLHEVSKRLAQWWDAQNPEGLKRWLESQRDLPKENQVEFQDVMADMMRIITEMAGVGANSPAWLLDTYLAEAYDAAHDLRVKYPSQEGWSQLLTALETLKSEDPKALYERFIQRRAETPGTSTPRTRYSWLTDELIRLIPAIPLSPPPETAESPTLQQRPNPVALPATPSATTIVPTLEEPANVPAPRNLKEGVDIIESWLTNFLDRRNTISEAPLALTARVAGAARALENAIRQNQATLSEASVYSQYVMARNIQEAYADVSKAEEALNAFSPNFNFLAPRQDRTRQALILRGLSSMNEKDRPEISPSGHTLLSLESKLEKLAESFNFSPEESHRGWPRPRWMIDFPNAAAPVKDRIDKVLRAISFLRRSAAGTEEPYILGGGNQENWLSEEFSLPGNRGFVIVDVKFISQTSDGRPILEARVHRYAIGENPKELGHATLSDRSVFFIGNPNLTVLKNYQDHRQAVLGSKEQASHIPGRESSPPNSRPAHLTQIAA